MTTGTRARIRSVIKKRLPIEAGVLLTFLLVPVWYRLPDAPFFLADLYTIRFLALLPMLWSIAWWLGLGLPGFKRLRRDRLRAIWALTSLLLALWAFASESWAFVGAYAPDTTRSAALQMGVAGLFALVVACAGPRTRTIVGALIFGTVWSAILAALQAARQAPVGLYALGEFPYTPDHPQAIIVQLGDRLWMRPHALMPHPNMLAGFLVVGLLATLVWVTADDRRLRWAGTLVFAGGLWGLLVTFSRSGVGGLVVGVFAIWPLLWRRKRRQLPVAGALAAVVAVIFALTYTPQLESRAGLGETQPAEVESLNARALTNGYALRSILENPVRGVGAGNFPWRVSFYLMGEPFDLPDYHAHHVLLTAWAELGIIGLALIVTALVSGIEATLERVRSGNPEGTVLLGGVIALAAIGLFDHYPWTILHFQALWWGLLGHGVGAAPRRDR